MNKLKSSGNLCFKEEEFLDKHFSVDKFVTKCKDIVSMTVLREDLETHYKTIQVALIELINRDYADFVSLSSNLIGTDKTISNLSTPLGQLKEEITSVKNDISNVLQKLEEKLLQRKLIRDKKTRTHHLINVVHSVEKIEKILTADPKSPDMEIFMNEDSNSPGHFLERIAGEFNQLQFHVLQSKGHPIIESIRPRVALITSKLQENLESTFEQGILNKQPDIILRCLRTHALIDKTSHAEELFRHLVVRPFVGEVVNEKYHSEHGTKKLCEAILKFIDDECNIVLSLTSEELSKRNELIHDTKEESVKGFDFLVNSVWVELVTAFEEKLPLLFSPGNPDLFLKRYKVMMNFLKDFEERCVSTESFKHLRKHPSYNSFMIKWSLPVYFQIRFQEIGGKVEMATDYPFSKSPEDFYMTNIVGTCWLGLLKCWSNDIYLPPLKGRFWKLNIQIISRLTMFIKSTINQQNIETSKEEISVENLALLLSDGLYFTKKLDEHFESNVKPTFLDSMHPIDVDLHKSALIECTSTLKNILNELHEHLVQRLTAESTSHLENVKNIPRLYRRTNKNPPTQPSSYVSSAFSLLNTFKATSETLESQQQHSIIKTAVTKMTTFYANAVDELLTSIRKTEESLLRLKQQRKAVAGQTSTTGTKNIESTDENKIRTQIYLDAIEYGNQLMNLGLLLDDFPDYIILKDCAEKESEATLE